MRVVVFFGLILSLALAMPNGGTDDDDRQEAIRTRGCIYIMGQCKEPCPVGTHAYTTGCSFLLPEATCANPHPVKDTRGGLLCDFSSCYCDAPTVRDEKTKKCVPVDQCS